MSEPSSQQRKAVAIRYQAPRDAAPVVVAKGRGWTAEKIIELARSHYIPIREDRNLVQVLGALDIDKEIPAEAYQAVAAILAFLCQINKPL